MIVGLFLLGSAWANEARTPTLCQATFTVPTPDCPWQDSMVVTGAGRNETKASHAATALLLQAVEAMAEARVRQTADSVAVAAATVNQQFCPQSAEDTVALSCTPHPQLRETVSCFASFDEDTCWQPRMIIEEGVGWKVYASVQETLCLEVAANLRTGELSLAEQQMCVTRCLLEASVRCPSASVRTN